MTNSSIDICIATYKRPENLLTLLDSLDKQEPKEVALRIIVVDNDRTASAKHVVERFQRYSRVETCYIVEERQGISHARNCAIDHATFEYIAFIDDDEIAGSTWIQTLWETIEEYNADIVFGPVFGIIPVHAPNWAKRHPSFARPNRADGTAVVTGGCGNVLMRRCSIKDSKIRFDPKFALTGGEDTAFFHSLHLMDRRMVWSSRSIVQETVPSSRLTISWVCRRAFRSGQTYARVYMRKMHWAQRALSFLIKILQISLALPILPIILVFSETKFVQLLCKVCAAIGQTSLILGERFLFHEYSANRLG